MKTILNRALYLFIKSIVRFLTWLFFRPKVTGRENIPPRGPFIIVSNHTSFLDPAIVQVSIPLKINWIVRKDVYDKWFLKPLHYIFDSLCINGVVKKAVSLLEEGRVVGMFPEGTRSRNGSLKEADLGVAILALKSGKNILPLGIRGAFEAFPPAKKLFRPHPIMVKIGKPFSFKKDDREVIEDPVLKKTRDYVMDRIKELLSYDK